MVQARGIIESAAISYLLSYKCLISKHLELSYFSGEPFSAYFVPAITTAAFSCELALKELNKRESSKTPKGHNLEKLFNLLSQANQENIVERTIKAYNYKSRTLNISEELSKKKFVELLNLHKDSFTIWRYFYEGISSMDLDFLEAFMFCLNGVEVEYGEYILTQLAYRK